MIGFRDANGNLTTRALLAGTGHDGSEALVTYEYHPTAASDPQRLRRVRRQADQLGRDQPPHRHGL
jgi:hypothetical protein